MNLRKLIRTVLKETYGPKTVMYSAVVIEDADQEQKIRDVAAKYVPVQGWTLPYHYHMTIAQGPIPESLELRGDLNKEVDLVINMIGQSEKAIAFGTFGYYSKNDMPHITIAFSKKNGALPSDSKAITDWKPIEKFTVTGIVRELGFGNTVLKESFQEKIRVDFDTMDIMLGDKIVGDFYMHNRRAKQYLTLNKIEIYPEYRSMGYATQAMNQIIDYANKNNLIIILTPEAYKSGGLSTKKLTDWYKSFGFILNKGKHKDFEHMHLLYKLPSGLDEMQMYKSMSTTPSREAHAGVPSEFPKPEDYDQFGNRVNDIAR